jgi:hypothetical protein
MRLTGHGVRSGKLTEALGASAGNTKKKERARAVVEGGQVTVAQLG